MQTADEPCAHTGKATEANGLMARCVADLWCFLPVKAAVGIGVPWMLDRWMRPQFGSTVTAVYLAVLTGVVGGIAAHNYRVFITVTP